MVPDKRKLMVVGAAIAAAFALPGCAPAGYNAAAYGNDSGNAQPAANAQDPTPSAKPSPSGTSSSQNASGLSDEQLTTELHGTAVPRMGEVIEDQNGWVLYRFDNDVAKPASKSNCNGDCAKVFLPALTTNGKPTLVGVSADKVGTVKRADGTEQLTVGGWPLYRYIGDKKKGGWKGQNVGGTWFVIKPDGTKNLTCVPAISKPVAPPADDSGAGSSSGSGASSSGNAANGSGTDYTY